MSHLTELETSGHEELIFPCDCMDQDYMRISWDDDPTFRYVWIEYHRWPRGWNRIRAAVAALRGKPWQCDEVILSDKTVDSLREFLDQR